MLKKFSNKLILYYVIVQVLLISGIFFILKNYITNTHLDLIKNEMVRDADLFNIELRESGLGVKFSPPMNKLCEEFSSIIKKRITIIDRSGKVIIDSEVKDPSTLDNHFYRKEVSDSMAYGQGYSQRYSNTLHTDMLYYAADRGEFILRLSRPLKDMEESISGLKKLILQLSVLGLIASVLVIIIITLRVTKPFNDTISFANDFASGDYSKRIMNYSNDEIGTLQRSLNKLADKIIATINEHIFEQRKLEATLENIIDGIAVIDSTRQILIANKSFSQILGIKINPKDHQYFEVIRNRKLNAAIDEAIISDGSMRLIAELQGDTIVETIITPIKGVTSVHGTLVVLHDISERMKIEKIKTDLVSNVSHELKTPIAIVKGYLETIKENPEDHEMTMNYIDRAIENVDRQNALIQDIIKLSMIESSHEFPVQDIDLRIIIENCIELLSPKIKNKNINFKADFNNRREYIQKGNLFLAEEIFFNLMDNAINYNNENGSLEIKVKETNGNAEISISDSGIGIPPEAIERIFERFYRVDKSRSRATGGTGLGLSIVKHAAQVLGWKVSVSSGANGTTFTIAT